MQPNSERTIGINRRLKAKFEYKIIEEISPKDIDGYKTFRRETVIEAKVSRDHATLRHIFDLAGRWK